MTKTKKRVKKYTDSDFIFILKAGFYLILGTCWLGWSNHRWIPVGVVVGFVFSRIEIFKLNRRIEYALLVVGALLGLYGLGLTIQL